MVDDLERALALVPKLEGLLEKATEGPWRVGQPDMSRIHTAWLDDEGSFRDDNFKKGGWPKTVAALGDEQPWRDIVQLVSDAHLIVELRNAAPTLLSALRTVEEERWQPIETAPDGWHRTYRVGESRPSWAYKQTHPDGEVEWSAPDGRTTVTHSTYAAPTHYLRVRIPPLPSAPVSSLGEGK